MPLTLSKNQLALAAVLAAGLAHAGQITITVVDRDGKPTPDAVVSLATGTKSARMPNPSVSTIVQEKMSFLPALSVVPVGATLRFVNNDPWDHHVRGTAAGIAQFGANAQGGFELRLAGKSDAKADAKSNPKSEVVMDKAGAVLLGCHLHSSMKGYVYVADSPWTMKTDANGVVQFDDVPNGTAVLKVWHGEQLLELPTQTVTVADQPSKANFALQITPRRRR